MAKSKSKNTSQDKTTTFDPDQYLGFADIADLAKTSTKTVRRWFAAGILPPHIVLPGGRMRRWRRIDVLNFLSSLNQPS